jgi:hypothetical protein
MAWCILLVLGGRGQTQAQGQSPLSANAINYINTYKSLAISEMQRSGVPASIILAQGIHESEAGTSELVLKSNNHFGIKCRDDWKGQVVYHDDDSRGECFRSYARPEDSYRDHSDFLRNSPRYADLFKYAPDDFEDWAYGLKKDGYATNIHYPQILIKLIRDYHLQQYTLIAMGRMKPEEELVLQATGSPAPPAVSGSAGSPSFLAVPAGSPSAPSAPADSVAAVQYPEGEFTINNTPVIFAKAGVSLLSIATQYEVPLGRLLEFNDLKEQDVLAKDQLLFLQRKRRTGATAFHIVKQGETLYDICQTEGLRYEDLVRMNQEGTGMASGGAPPANSVQAQLAAGEKVWLKPKERTN